jgi:hypothetical protein
MPALFSVPERYELVRLANGAHSIRSLAEHETFHPVAGPAAEAEALYVTQLRLPERLAASRDEFVIWDVGLGAGGNVFTALRCCAGIAARVRIVSFDRTLEPFRFALDHAEELVFPRGFEMPAQTLLAGREACFVHGALQVTWRVHVGDFPSALKDAAAAAHGVGTPLPRPAAVFHDAFSPARNPEMWTLSLFENLRVVMGGHPCNLATFSRSTMARGTMLLAGLFVGVGAALAGKEETTVASTDLTMLDRPLGHDWLARARRSHAAEPLRQPEHRQSPLSPATWAALRRHPQFANG